MPDLLNTSLTGMLAFQRALDVTGHNIANANTPGYSRQVVEFATRGRSGRRAMPTSAAARRSRRSSACTTRCSVEQLQTATTGQTRFDTLNTLAGRVDVTARRSGHGV